MLDGYIRVSQVAGRSGDTFISPAVQREQIQGWASVHGVVIGRLFEELDESGARGDRPMLLEAIERVEKGQSGGIIVARLDRFGRSLRDGIAAIERIRDARGTFVSVQDGLDLGTATGKLVFHILLSMGEWELDRIRTTWEIAKARAISRGVHVGSTPPFGYRRDRAGRLRIDSRSGPLVRDLFERRAEGATLAELGAWLEEQQVRTTRGNPLWRDTTVRGILLNRVYLGELRSGSEIARGTHMPLVDSGTWQRAQRPRTGRIPHEKTATLLGGLLRCWSCRMVLHSQTVSTKSGRRIANYTCHARSSQKRCRSAAYITGPVIEPYVEQAFFGELCFRERGDRASQERLRVTRQKLAEAERVLDLYRDDPRVLRVLGQERYLAGLDVRVRAVDLAMQALASEERRADSLSLPKCADLEDRWPSMSVAERRAAIGQLVDCVFVRRGWGNVAERVFVCFRGHQPPDLPVRGAHRPLPTPFNPRTVAAQRKPKSPRKWRRDKTYAKLAEFLNGRSEWPTPEEFMTGGHGPLYAQIVRSGGPEHWALRMSVQPPRKKQGVRAWNQKLAERTLREFVRRKKSFPTRREFSEHGFRGLHNWLAKNGGLNEWARRMDLPRNRSAAK